MPTPAKTVKPATAAKAAGSKPKVLQAKVAAPAAEVPTVGDSAMTTENVTDAVKKSLGEVLPAIEKAAAETMEKAKAQYEIMNAKLAEAMEQTMKSMTDMNEFAKGNVEAMIASAKAATAGAETLTAAIVENSKKSFEEAQATFKAITAAKSPNEALQLQSEFAKAQFEKTVAAWSQFSEAMLKASGEVFQPLSSRMALAAESVKKAYAA